MDDIRDVMVKIDINFSILERKIKRLAKELDDMADDRRIIKGWTDEERRELEEYKKEPKSSMLKVFYDLFSGYEFYPNLCNKVRSISGGAHMDQENQFVNDVVDYFNDDAKFPEEKWYVHFVKSDEDSYLNYGLVDDTYFVSGKEQNIYTKKQFTKQEVEDINPKYLEFLEKVPVEELED